jgi:membrane-associated phospholipid phosphatase
VGGDVIGDRSRLGSTEVRPRTWPFPPALLFVVLVSLAVFTTLAVEVSLRHSLAIDRLSMDVLRHGEERPSLVDALQTLGVAGSAPGTIAASVIVLGVLLALRRGAAAVFFLAAVAVAGLSEPLKSVIHRPPRTAPWGGSTTGFFPSGHATGSMAVCAAIVALVWKTPLRVPTAIAASIVVVVVGLSAVYDGGHWPSDVLGGWMLSLGWVAVLCIAWAWYGMRQKRRPMAGG